MRNMSFSLTKEQVRKQIKTVTRRFGWWFLIPGDRVQPVEKCMGLKKGEKVVKIGGPIEIMSTRAEVGHPVEGQPLFGVTGDECLLEGFPEMEPEDFIAMVKRLQKRPGEACNRIQFRYLEIGEASPVCLVGEGRHG